MKFTISCNEFIKNYTGSTTMYGIYVANNTIMEDICECPSAFNPSAIVGGNGWPTTDDKKIDPLPWPSPANWYSIYDNGSNGGFQYHSFENEYIGNPISNTVFPVNIVTGFNAICIGSSGETNTSGNFNPTCLNDIDGNIVFTRPTKNTNNDNNKYQVSKEAYETDKNYLSQNQPNPFTEEVKIDYHLVKEVKYAQLEIFELVSGRKLKVVHLNNNDTLVNINLSEYAAGMYMYRLVVDNEVMESKWMLKVK